MGDDKNPKGTGKEYYYQLWGSPKVHEVKSSKEEIDRARAYFEQKTWQFPDGICSVATLKSGSLILAIDENNRQAGKKSIVEVLGLPAPW